MDEEPQVDRPDSGRPAFEHPVAGQPSNEHSAFDKPPTFEKPAFDTPAFGDLDGNRPAAEQPEVRGTNQPPE